MPRFPDLKIPTIRLPLDDDPPKLEIPESWLRQTRGMKYDAGKLGYDLIDDAAEAEFVAVLTYGAVKYDPDNWALVDDAERRYYAAARRHMAADRRGEIFDEEHGLLALAGAICDLHFLLALRIRKNPELAKSLPERLKKALAVARKFREEREAQKTEASRVLAAMMGGEEEPEETIPKPNYFREAIENRLKEYEQLGLIPPPPIELPNRMSVEKASKSVGAGLGHIERRERRERQKKPRKTSKRKKN